MNYFHSPVSDNLDPTGIEAPRDYKQYWFVSPFAYGYHNVGAHVGVFSGAGLNKDTGQTVMSFFSYYILSNGKFPISLYHQLQRPPAKSLYPQWSQ